MVLRDNTVITWFATRSILCGNIDFGNGMITVYEVFIRDQSYDIELDISFISYLSS